MVEKEVIKVELPKPLAEKFRRYVAERYGLRKGALSVDLAEEVGLDFDDSLHYYVAKKLGAAIVSCGRDFGGLDVKRLTPGELVQRAGVRDPRRA